MSDTENQIAAARQLLAGALRGVLSTHCEKFEGYPFGSLVPYCLDSPGIPVLLLSHLSQHTRNLEADPKVALTVAEQGRGDVQTLARLTCIAKARPQSENLEDISSRYFRYFPASQRYFEQLNFRFYRLEPVRFYFVGGFGAARWFGTDRILLANPLTPEQERSIVQHMQEDHPDALRTFLANSANSELDLDTEIAVVGIDSLGIDLRQGDQLTRVPLRRPIGDISQARTVLSELAG